MGIEILGYVSTVVTLLSFLVEKQLKLRIINTCGAILWVVYGVLITSNPVILTNALIIVFNGKWLYFNWRK